MGKNLGFLIKTLNFVLIHNFSWVTLEGSFCKKNGYPSSNTIENLNIFFPLGYKMLKARNNNK